MILCHRFELHGRDICTHAPDRDLNQVLNENAMGISDVTPYDTIEDAAQGMLTGDAILFPRVLMAQTQLPQ